MKLREKLFLAGLSLISCAISFQVAEYIAENLFFDRVFYQKSAAHGYAPSNDFSFENLNKKSETRNRVSDLYQIFSQDNEKILGSQSASDLFTVAVIGDSMVYGQGVKNNQIFTKVLEEKMNHDRKTKVYGLGVPGDDFVDNFIKYKKIKETVNPDLVIFILVDNDLTFNETKKYPNREFYKQELSRGCEKPEMEYEWKNMSGIEQIGQYYFPSVSAEYSNGCIFVNGIKQIDKTNTIFASFDNIDPIYSSPDTNANWKDKLSYVLNFFKSQIVNQGGYFVDNRKYNFSAETISTIEGHPSKESHAKFADLIFSEIKQHENWKSKNE